MKNTKGKWQISNLGNLYGFKDCIVSEVKDETYPKYTDSPTKINVIATMQYWNKDENKANANLIAAAPDLLRAIKPLVKRIKAEDSWAKDYIQLVHAEEAIAKAEGK